MGFGDYSAATKDQNKRNTGYSNSLNEGPNFSTTLGPYFSTTVGPYFSTIGGMKLDVLTGASVKNVSGLLDFDSKFCKVQVKANYGIPGGGSNIYTWNTGTITEYKGAPLGGDTKIVDKKVDFAKQANEWLGTKNLVAQSEIKKIIDGDLSYVSLTQNVVREVSQLIGGSNSATASIHNLNSSQGGQVSVGALVRITAPTVKITGTLVNIG